MFSVFNAMHVACIKKTWYVAILTCNEVKCNEVRHAMRHAMRHVIVVEGIFDAIVLDSVAILGSEIAHKQKLQINSLNREVIVVPDRDKAGTKLIDQAIEYNW